MGFLVSICHLNLWLEFHNSKLSSLQIRGLGVEIGFASCTCFRKNNTIIFLINQKLDAHYCHMYYVPLA